MHRCPHWAKCSKNFPSFSKLAAKAGNFALENRSVPSNYALKVNLYNTTRVFCETGIFLEHHVVEVMRRND